MNKDYVVTCDIYEFDGDALVGVTTADATVGVHGEGVPLSMFKAIETQMIEQFGSSAVVLFKGIAPKVEGASDE